MSESYHSTIYHSTIISIIVISSVYINHRVSFISYSYLYTITSGRELSNFTLTDLGTFCLPALKTRLIGLGDKDCSCSAPSCL